MVPLELGDAPTEPRMASDASRRSLSRAAENPPPNHPPAFARTIGRWKPGDALTRSLARLVANVRERWTSVEVDDTLARTAEGIVASREVATWRDETRL